MKLKSCRRLLGLGLTMLSLTPLWADEAGAARISTKDAVRFLNQSSFGATRAAIARVQQIGYDVYLTEQFSLPLSDYPNLEFWPTSRPETCTGTCARDNYTYYQLQKHFFTNCASGSPWRSARFSSLRAAIFRCRRGCGPTSKCSTPTPSATFASCSTT
jgi:hypothetical protein